MEYPHVKIFRIFITSRSGKVINAFYAGHTGREALNKAYQHNKSLQADFGKYCLA